MKARCVELLVKIEKQIAASSTAQIELFFKNSADQIRTFDALANHCILQVDAAKVKELLNNVDGVDDVPIADEPCSRRTLRTICNFCTIEIWCIVAGNAFYC